MRHRLKALPVVAALLGAAPALAPASSVAPRSLTPHQLSARVAWLAGLDAKTVAYGDRRVGSGIDVLADSGTPRAVPAPPGCAGAAAGADHLLFDCPTGDPNRFDEVVTAPDGTTQATLDYHLLEDGGDRVASSPSAIGDQWLHQDTSCLHCGQWPIDVNWRTGETRALTDASTGWLEDLDAPALRVPLCASLQRVVPIADEDAPLLLGAQVDGPWALVQGQANTVGSGWTLRRCGSTKVYKTPARTTPLALGGGFVVLWGTIPGRGAFPSLALLRLRDQRVFRVAGVWSPSTGADPAATYVLTRRRLVIRGDAVSDRSLWSVTLPQR